jgi:uncharacterized membrane protein
LAVAPIPNHDDELEVLPPVLTSMDNKNEMIQTSSQIPQVAKHSNVFPRSHETLDPIYINMKAARFDPLIMEPEIPRELSYNFPSGYYLLQCNGPIMSDWVLELQDLKTEILGYIPDYTFLINIDDIEKLLTLPFIRWIGIYHPAYKIQEGLLEKEGEVQIDVVVFKDKSKNLENVREKLKEWGGEIKYDGNDNHIITAKVDASQIEGIASILEVEWINEFSEPVGFMNKVRSFTGTNYIDLNGYDGTGIVGEVKDNGIQDDHPDFIGQLIATDGNPPDGDHGTCTFGIVFASGANDADATGMLPGGEGVFCYWTVTRTNSINRLVNNWGGVFQSNSWSQGNLDSSYTSYTREDDQLVYDNDVVMLYAAGNSNQGVYSESMTQDSVAKNVIGVGAVSHFDDENRDNHFWVNWGAGMTPSQGPAADGRIKPDLAGVFDWIYTTDSVDGDGEDGYATGNYYSNMGGTSGATPIAAGATGLVYEMYQDNFFGNNPSNSTPHAATVKALLIADAYQYDFTQANRYQQGWGLVDVQNVYDIGKNHYIVDQDVSLETGKQVNYSLTPTMDNPMKISLVWTDVPGTTSSSQHLINNLDLKVTDPEGKVYLGNYGLDNSKWSITGGTADTLNNVENVFIENPIPGKWTVEIIGENVPMDGDLASPEIDQHFALVASNVHQYIHDLGVSDLDIEPYVAPGVQKVISASVYNNGIIDENDILVNFTVDSIILDSQIIPNLKSGNSSIASFNWTPAAGIYLVRVEVEILPDENFTANNVQERIVIAEPDVMVSSLQAPKFSRPSQDVTINATITNLGKVDLSSVQVQLLINGTMEDITSIPSLLKESSGNVSFTWAPTLEGWSIIEIYAEPHAEESLIGDNRLNTSILITSQDPLNVVILDSWGTDYPEDAPWDYITSNWVDFGSIPVSIDYTSLNKDDITYSDISSTNADVLLISCPYFWEFTDNEIEAISDYVRSGKGLVATSATFLETVPNNNKLAFLFGMRDDLSYDADFTPTLNLTFPGHPLFVNVPNPYTTGSEITISPTDLTWDADDIINGTYVAKSEDDLGAIITHKGVVYISHWVEYMSNSDDMQLLYNAMTWSKWQRDQHDLSVSDIQVDRYVSFGEQVDVNAQLKNLGLSDEAGVTVSLYANGALESQTTIPFIASDDSQMINFIWDAPFIEDTYTIKIEVASLPGENYTKNNAAEATSIVTDGPNPGTIGLISDSSQLHAVTSILDELTKSYDLLDDNSIDLYTSDIMLLLQYETVIFYNQNRLIDVDEQQALNDYIELGGALVVTGFDSLGSPDDNLLANVVRSTDIGDNMGENSFSVIDEMHPITSSIFGQYSQGTTFTVGQTDHDNAEADTSRGAQTVCELNDGYDKIISTQMPLGGRVIYWNGNEYCEDWTSPETEDLFKNLIVWLMPIYNDIGIEFLQLPLISFVNESVGILASVINLGLNDTGTFDVELTIRNSFGYTMFSEIKSVSSLSSLQNSLVAWQWLTPLSGIYDVEVNILINDDEIPGNNMISDQLTVYYKFLDDDMEDGTGGWTPSASSLSPLWHLTTLESYSPTTSWWCGMDTATQYTVLAEQYLTTEVIDLTDASSGFLTFYNRYSIDDYPIGGDWGVVEINSGGSGWTQIDSYSGTFFDWNQIILDISPYIGETIQIRFHLHAGVILTDNGWWVDDVLVYGLKNQYGIELSVIVDSASAGKDEFAYYDFIVKNIGNVFADFTFDVQGGSTQSWSIGFTPNSISLVPNSEFAINLSILPYQTEAGDYSFWVAGDAGSGGSVKAQDSLILYLTINPWYGVDISIQDNLLYLIPGETDFIEVEITNNGNVFDTILLGTENYMSGSSTSWDFELNQISIGLDAFESDNITLTVHAPLDGVSGDYIVVNVTSSSQTDPGQFSKESTTTTIIDYFLLDMESQGTAKETKPGVPVQYNLTITNMGNTQVTVEMDISPFGNWNGWMGIFDNNDFLVDAYTSEPVVLTITPLNNLLENEFKEFQISASTIYNVSLLNVKTVISRTGEIEIDVDESLQSAKIGEWTFYEFMISNTQNAEDTIDVRASSLNGWDVEIFKWDGETALMDTDSDSRPDTGLLEAWDDSEDIVVGVCIPSDALVSDDDRITITFISSLVNGTTHSIDLVATAEASGGIVLSAVSYSESASSGSYINYWITVENYFNYETEIDITLTSQKNWEVELFLGDGASPLSDSNSNGISDTGSLSEFGGVVDLVVVLNIPKSTLAYTMNQITLKASSSEHDGGVATILLNATVSRLYDFEIKMENERDLEGKLGKEIEFTIMVTNNGNYEETVNLRFSELPFGWKGYFSNREPSVPIGGFRGVTVSLEIPSDAEPGDYLVYITGTSSDDVESTDLSVSVSTQKEEESLDLSFFLLLVVLIVVVAILLAVAPARSRSKKANAPSGDYGVMATPRVTAKYTQAPVQHYPAKTTYQGPIFPSFETIKCPVCYAAFEVEVGKRPLRVECPNCGAAGTIN